jgi:hypothetical protein
MFFYLSLPFCEKKTFMSHYCLFCNSSLEMADDITRPVPSMLSIIGVIITEILRVCEHREEINVFISGPVFLSHDCSCYITKFQSEMKQYCQQRKEKYLLPIRPVRQFLNFEHHTTYFYPKYVFSSAKKRAC